MSQKTVSLKKLIEKLAKYIFHAHGWRLIGPPVPKEAMRCVFVFAPHTSNWDWYFGTLCMLGWGIPMKVAIKKYWMRFPLGIFVRMLGGVGVDRSGKNNGGKRLSQVEALANTFKEYKNMAFVITPEGSRAPRDRWKTGFYHIAQLAKVPIVLLSTNFPNRTIEFGPILSAEESIDTVMRAMMEFYRRGVGVRPDSFLLDTRYI